MAARRKIDLDRRLEAHFATLRSSSLREVLKRSAGNWQIYAAVTGSAMAMATSASASILGSGMRDVAAVPIAGVMAATQHFARSRNTPLMNAVRLAIARQNSGETLFDGASVQVGQAAPVQAPSITPGGVVPIFGTAGTIQPGEWITIYGNNLASGTAIWNSDFPTSLGGTSVTIDNKFAYLMFVSPGQINLQAPDDTATGTVSVVVTTAGGSATSTVVLNPFAPSFSLLNVPSIDLPKSAFGFVSGIILRSNGSGAYGGGTYDILGPTGNSFGYSTVAATEGDIVELFGVGFGPTTPAVPAGVAFTGAAPIDNSLTLYINNAPVNTTFVGLSSAGLYQVNLTVPPGLGEGEVPIQATVGGMQTQSGVLFSLKAAATAPTNSGTAGAGPQGSGGGSFGGSFGGSWGGSGGGFGGGSGGGSGDIRRKGKPYVPKLRFPPK